MKKAIVSLLAILLLLGLLAPTAAASPSVPPNFSFNSTTKVLTWDAVPTAQHYWLHVWDSGGTLVHQGFATSPYNVAAHVTASGEYRFSLIAEVGENAALPTNWAHFPSDTTYFTVNPTISVPAGNNITMARGTTRQLTATTSLPLPVGWRIEWSIVQTVTNVGLNPTVGSPTTVSAGNVDGTATILADIFDSSNTIVGSPALVTVTVRQNQQVTFNTNGGVWPTAPHGGTRQHPALETYGAAISAAGTPRRLGHVFDGWFDTQANANRTGLAGRVSADTPVTAGASRTLWARWTPLTSNARGTIATTFPDTNLQQVIIAALNQPSVFGANAANADSRIFQADLNLITTLDLRRPSGQGITDLRGTQHLTNVTSVTNAVQTLTLSAVQRTNPLVHANIVRNSAGNLIAPATISNNGTHANGSITWENLPTTQPLVTYTWSQNVTIGTAPSFTFNGTVTLPFAAMRFVDVHRTDWFYPYVRFVYERDIMQGLPNNRFGPNESLSRAQVAVILYRMVGSPTVTARPPFTDVPSGVWYSNAITWAYGQGIVQGVGGGRFAPHETITREQFAAMLYRYADFMNYDLSVPANFNLNQFPDRGQVNSWAIQYLRWAVHNGIVTGTTGGLLNPQGSTTRAECAAMVQRFIMAFES